MLSDEGSHRQSINPTPGAHSAGAHGEGQYISNVVPAPSGLPITGCPGRAAGRARLGSGTMKLQPAAKHRRAQHVVRFCCNLPQ